MLSIKRIIIKNFRQYKDINLELHSPSGLFLFIGKNGMGKSNFLNAICWCLYGKQPFKFHDKEKQIINEETSQINKYEETSVSIEVLMDDKEFVFKRTGRETQKPELTVLLKHGQDWNPVQNPNLIINNFLPESVRKFFLFDGEAVQNLYKGDYSQNLKSGVWIVSNVELLDRASDNVSKTRDDIRKNLSREDPITELLEKSLEKLQIEKNSLELNLQSKLTEVDTLKEQSQELSEKLKNSGKFKELQDKRDLLQKNLSESKKRLEEYQNQLNDLLIYKGPFWYVKDSILELSSKITDENSKGKLPPKIKSTFIKELIEKGQCICGRPIIANNDEYKHLEDLLSSVEILDSRSYLLEDRYKINSVIKELEFNYYNDIKNIREFKAKERKEIDSIQVALGEISKILTNSADKQVGDLESTKIRIESQINIGSQEIGQLKEKLRVCENTLKESEDKLKKLNSNKAKRQLEKDKFEFLEEADDKINYIKERIIRQVKESVSLRTDEYFKNLMWKKDDFDKVNFTDEYKVEIFKKGEDISSLEILSTGEMKVLSFATMKALAELSGFNEVPLFIDGPLENLDTEVRENFLSLLPSFSPGKQVFIFSLDYDEMKKFGQEQVPKDNFYKLIRDEGSLSTSIIKA